MFPEPGLSLFPWAASDLLTYINAYGKIQDELRRAIKEGTLTLPAGFEPQRDQITGILRKLVGRIEVKNADEKKTVDQID